MWSGGVSGAVYASHQPFVGQHRGKWAPSGYGGLKRAILGQKWSKKGSVGETKNRKLSFWKKILINYQIKKIFEKSRKLCLFWWAIHGQVVSGNINKSYVWPGGCAGLGRPHTSHLGVRIEAKGPLQGSEGLQTAIFFWGGEIEQKVVCG